MCLRCPLHSGADQQLAALKGLRNRYRDRTVCCLRDPAVPVQDAADTTLGSTRLLTMLAKARILMKGHLQLRRRTGLYVDRHAVSASLQDHLQAVRTFAQRGLWYPNSRGTEMLMLTTAVILALLTGWQVLFEGKLLLFEDNHAQYPLSVMSVGAHSRVESNITSRGLTLVAGNLTWTLRAADAGLAAEWCRALQRSIAVG